MKYEFKAQKVFKDIERSVWRFLNEYAPNHKLIVPVTNDPCTFVGAWVLSKICSNRFEAVYLKDPNTDSNKMEEAVQVMMENFDDRFTLINLSTDYPSFGKFYGELMSDNPISTMRIQYDALELFLLSKYRDVKPVIVSTVDFIRGLYKIGINRTSLCLFRPLYFPEIIRIGIHLGLDKKLLKELFETSEVIATFHREVGIDILNTADEFRIIPKGKPIEDRFKGTDYEEPLESAEYKYTPPVLQAAPKVAQLPNSIIQIQNYSLYDIYAD